MSDTQPGIPQIVDPSTVATDAALVRALAAERDYVDGKIDILLARLDGMDEAAKVLHETVTRTPTDIQQAVGHLRELTDEKFQSVRTRFEERDTRAERESRDNKIAVDAAFASQKEIAANEREATATAIDKSEKATEKIIDAQRDGIGDLKTRVERLESIKVGATEQRIETREGVTFAQGLIGTAVVLLVVLLNVVGILYSRASSQNTPPAPAVVTVTQP